MGKKSKPPPPPDYAAIAQQQAAASKDLTNQQTEANRPNINTPWGSQTWEQNGNQWTQNTTLSPQQQQALDSQMAVTTGRSQAAEGLLSRSVDAFGKPVDYSGISAGAGRLDPQRVGQGGQIQGQLDTGDGGWRQRGQDAALEFMRPQQEQRQQGLESQLANMGLTRGSEAWNREMQRNSDQTTRDSLQAFGAGQSESNLMAQQAQMRGQFANQAQQQGFGQQAQAAGANNAADLNAGNFNQGLRQQEISEMMQQRNVPLNEMNAFLTGQQVQAPNMPQFNTAQRPETPQMLNAANMGYQAQLDASNASNAGQAGLMGGLFSMGSAAMGAGGWGGLFNMGGSERSYKEQVRRIGTHDKLGIGIYQFVYSPSYAGKWGTGVHTGVMAHELREVAPHLVSRDADGDTVVDYSGVWQ